MFTRTGSTRMGDNHERGGPHGLIDLRNVTVYRGGKKILDEFSLSLPLRRSIAVLGPNGAGKTTLLKVLMRELYPVKSADMRVRILGRESWNVWELRNELGFISQDLQNRYLGHVRGVEVVLSGYYSSVGVYQHHAYAPEAFVRAETVMRQLGIDSLRERLYSTLSTGEQRRFLLGRALVSEPATLVLDEPTSGLDVNATFQYLRTIRRLMGEGTQIVLVTHHIHEIPPEIDHVVLLQDGHVVADGRKQDILTTEMMSELYSTPVKVLTSNGYFQVVPAD